MDEFEPRALEAIRYTLATYNWCGDNGDYEGYVATFAPDAVLEIKGGGAYHGHPGIRRALDTAFGATPEELALRRQIGGRFSHHVSSVRIQLVSATEALSWSYFQVIGKSGPDHWGRYTDRLVPVGTQWLLAHRRVSIDGHSPGAVMYSPR